MSNAQFWRVTARTSDEFLRVDWRARMIELLGYKPRRISSLAESVLYGALDCLTQVADFNADNLSVIRLTSVRGPYTASIKVMRSSETELPMPFTFLQSQISQALVALVSQLKWQGDASILMTSNPVEFARMALIQSQHGVVLLGGSEEIHEASTPLDNYWFYLTPCATPVGVVFTPMVDLHAKVDYWKLDVNGLSGA